MHWKFYLTDENQEAFKVKKEVTGNVYRNHVVGDTIKISYMNGNPYNVFVPRLFLVFYFGNCHFTADYALYHDIGVFISIFLYEI